MALKKTGIIIVVVGLMAWIVGAANAQETTAPERIGRQLAREVIQIVADETGLDPQDILAQLRDDMTLADIIAGNGGDVDAVIDAAVAAMREQINTAVADGKIAQARADRLLSNLEDIVTRGINGDLLPRRDGRPLLNRARSAAARNLIDTVADATGLSAPEVVRQVRQGSTLAEIVEANGGSTDAVIADALTNASERVNGLVDEGALKQEQADELLASLETIYTDIVNGDLPLRPNRPNRIETVMARAVLRAASEQTGLEVSEIAEKLKTGSTLADVLTANGVDVTAFIDGLVAKAEARLDQAVQIGRITQARADELLDALRHRLTERINAPVAAQES